VIRRLAGVLLVACVLAALAAAGASAAFPEGPRLTFVRAGEHIPQLVSSDPAGGDQTVLAPVTGSHPLPFPLSPPSWSADGSRVAFSAFPDQHVLRIDAYVAAADGSGVTEVPGTRDAFSAVLSPDGQTLAFTRQRQREARRPGRGEVTVFRSISVWLVSVAGGPPRQLTPWRNHLFQYPSSFSPDGSTLALTRESGAQHLAVALDLTEGGATVLARHAGEPVYSPDGSRLALVAIGRPKTIRTAEGKTTYTPTELAVANADGSELRRLTSTPGALELLPSWDPSGQRLAYTQIKAAGGLATLLGIGDSIMEINADGTCRTKILSDPKTSFYGATWQPGPGREAGPISC
jgi:Tol biopolymer transport system component